MRAVLGAYGWLYREPDPQTNTSLMYSTDYDHAIFPAEKIKL